MTYQEFSDSERNGWNERAEGYDRATALGTTQIVPALLMAARVHSGARLLDVACGPGYAAGAASVLGADADGIDIAPRMIAQARSRFPEVNFREGSGEKLDAEDSSYDAVVCNIGLFHMADPGKAIGEAFRVLRPGGFYAFSQWCAPSESPLYATLFAAMKDRVDMSLASSAPDAFDLSDRDHAGSLMRQAGFDNIEIIEVPSVVRVRTMNFYDFFMEFGVRVPLIMAHQDEDVRNRVRDEVQRTMQPFGVDGQYSVPMPSIVFSGQRPAFGKESS